MRIWYIIFGDIMKKKLLIILFAFIVFVSISSLIYAGITLNTQEKEKSNHLIELSYNELEKKINKKESFILVVTRTNCSHCIEYKPVLKDVLLKYNITAYEIDTEKMTKQENAKFKDIANISGTPTTLFVENGIEKNTSTRIVGSTNSTKIINRFKAMGYIKK